MIYRLRQGFRALGAWAAPLDWARAEAILSPNLMALFRRMRRSEQIHSLNVLRTLTSLGHDQPDLLTAALLHDCGKSRYPYTLFDRTLVVLAKHFAPRRYARWSSGQPNGWTRRFVIATHHPAWSAKDMELAGATPQAVSLARRHQVPVGDVVTEEDRLLALLQAADDDN